MNESMRKNEKPKMSQETAEEIIAIEKELVTVKKDLMEIAARINLLKHSEAPEDVIADLERRYLELLRESMLEKFRKGNGGEGSPEVK